MRKPLAENIILVGGSVMMPGFKARLLAELKALLASPLYKDKLHITTFKFHTPPGKENYAAWLGGQWAYLKKKVGIEKNLCIFLITSCTEESSKTLLLWAFFNFYNFSE